MRCRCHPVAPLRSRFKGGQGIKPARLALTPGPSPRTGEGRKAFLESPSPLVGEGFRVRANNPVRPSPFAERGSGGEVKIMHCSGADYVARIGIIGVRRDRLDWFS